MIKNNPNIGIVKFFLILGLVAIAISAPKVASAATAGAACSPFSLGKTTEVSGWSNGKSVTITLKCRLSYSYGRSIMSWYAVSSRPAKTNEKVTWPKASTPKAEKASLPKSECLYQGQIKKNDNKTKYHVCNQKKVDGRSYRYWGPWKSIPSNQCSKVGWIKNNTGNWKRLCKNTGSGVTKHRVWSGRWIQVNSTKTVDPKDPAPKETDPGSATGIVESLKKKYDNTPTSNLINIAQPLNY